MSLNTSALLGVAQKGGRSVAIVLDSSTSGTSLFFYDSTAAVGTGSGYTARIDSDGSYTAMGGGQLTGTQLNCPNFTVPNFQSLFGWYAGPPGTTQPVATLSGSGHFYLAGSLQQNSSLALKKNVVTLDPRRALAAVLESRLIRFDWISETSNEQRHASWSAQETPAELSGPTRDSFDAMSGVAYAFAAIQQLQVQIEVLQSTIETLQFKVWNPNL